MKIEKADQYAQISVENAIIDDTFAKEIESKIVGLYKEGYTNFIVDIAEVDEIEDGGLNLIKKINQLCHKENGMMVLTTQNNDLADFLDEAKLGELIIMNSVEEAKEAIYLNDLENEFMEDDDEPNYGEEASEESDY